MSHRDDALQKFVDAAREAFDRHARDPQSRRAAGRIFSALEASAALRSGPGRRLPVCSWLDQALATAAAYRPAEGLIERFRVIEPSLEWSRRPKSNATASDNFAEGHANAMIIGPGGFEDRTDVWVGVSLLAPRVRYPDHDHAPEEVYLVLSEGEFRHGESSWFSPGIGGSFYNEPGIRHAMRSGSAPLLAFWILLAQGGVGG